MSAWADAALLLASPSPASSCSLARPRSRRLCNPFELCIFDFSYKGKNHELYNPLEPDPFQIPMHKELHNAMHISMALKMHNVMLVAHDSWMITFK